MRLRAVAFTLTARRRPTPQPVTPVCAGLFLMCFFLLGDAKKARAEPWRVAGQVSSLHHLETPEGPRLLAVGVGGAVTCIAPDSGAQQKRILWRTCRPGEVGEPDELLLESAVGASGDAVFVWSRRGCAIHRVDVRTCEVDRQRLRPYPLNLGGGVMAGGTRLIVASPEHERLFAAWAGGDEGEPRRPPWEVGGPASTLSLVGDRLVVGFQHSRLAAGTATVSGGPPLLSEVVEDRRLATILDFGPGGGGTAGGLRVGFERVSCVGESGMAPPLRRPGVESLHGLPGGRLAMVLDIPAPRRRQ